MVMNTPTSAPAAESALGDSPPLRNLQRTFALLSLLLVLFGAVLSWMSWHAEFNRQANQLAILAEMGEQALNTYLGSIARALRDLSREIGDADGKIDLETTAVKLQRFKKSHAELRAVNFNSVDGQILASSERLPSGRLPSLANQVSFQLSVTELQQGAALSIGRPLLGPLVGEWIIPIRYGIRDSDGKLRFILAAGLPVTRTYDFWKDAPLPPGTALGMMRDDFYLLSRYPLPPGKKLDDLLAKPRTGPMARYIEQHNYPLKGIVDGVSSVSAENALFAFHRLQDYPITFSVATPKSNIWAAWRQNMLPPFVLMLLWIISALVIYRWIKNQQQAWEIARETRLQLAVEAAQVGTWSRDLTNNTVQWSAEFKRLLGYAPHELQASPEELLARLHPDDRERTLTRLQHMDDGAHEHFENEQRIRHRDGDYRTFLTRGALLRNPVTNTAQLLGAAVDITARRATEDSLRQSERNLAESQRMTRELIEALPNPIFYKNVEGRYLGVNRAWEAFFGVAREDFAGKRVQDLYPANPEIAERLHRMDLALWERPGAQEIETTITTPDGETREVVFYKATYTHADGSVAGLIGTIVDITRRKQAEASLRESEQNLAITLHSIGDAVIATDAAGLITRMNPTAERLTGWTLAQAQGLPLTAAFRIINVETRLPATNPAQLAMAQGAMVELTHHTALIARDGREYQISDSAAPIRDSGGGIVGAVLVFSDVTEQYRVRQALQEREALLATLTARIHIGLVMLSADHRYVFANAAYAELLGLPPGELIGRHMRDVLGAVYETRIRPWMERAFAGERGGYERTLPLREDETSARIISVTYDPPVETAHGPCIIMASMDITARKQAEHNQTRLAAIVESSNDAIYSRALDGTILTWNAGAERLLGYSALEMIGHPVSITLPPNQQAMMAETNAALLRGEAIVNEHTRITKDGRIIAVMASRSPLRDEFGNIVGASVILQDITERKAAERTQAQLAAIVENTYDAIIGRAPDDTIISWNAAAERMFGWSATEAIGRPFRSLLVFTPSPFRVI